LEGTFGGGQGSEKCFGSLPNNPRHLVPEVLESFFPFPYKECLTSEEKDALEFW